MIKSSDNDSDPMDVCIKKILDTTKDTKLIAVVEGLGMNPQSILDVGRVHARLTVLKENGVVSHTPGDVNLYRLST